METVPENGTPPSPESEAVEADVSPPTQDDEADQTPVPTTDVDETPPPQIDTSSLPESKSETPDVEVEEEDPDPPVKEGEASSDVQTQDSDAESQTTDVKTASSDAFYPARQPISSIPKSLTLETSTPSSSRNSSPMVDDATSLQDKVSSSDGPTSCSTPASNDSEDMVSAHEPLSTSTPSRPLDLDFEGSIASQMTMGSTQTFHSAVTFVEPEIRAPIVGYEIMEQRAKFTVSDVILVF